MATDYDRVSSWLKQTWKVPAPRDWLEACVDWVKAEQQGNVAYKDLCQLVLEQYLCSDLTTIGCSSLPDNCAAEAKLTLNGSYCLQVNSVLDVGSSFYSQIQKLYGTENENALVSATQMSQTQAPKAGRMLLFDLTDGVQSIRGMEYQPLPGFEASMAPGTKVLIQGPVLCRRGVVMLTKNSLVLLGGELESLADTNSRFNVTKCKLTENTSDGGRRPELPRQTFESRASVKTSQPPATQRNDNMAGRGHCVPPRPQQGGGRQNINHGPPPMDDDFMDDIDPDQLAALEDQWGEDDDDLDNLLMNSMEQQTLRSMSRSSGAQQASSFQRPQQKNQPAANTQHRKKQNNTANSATQNRRGLVSSDIDTRTNIDLEHPIVIKPEATRSARVQPPVRAPSSRDPQSRDRETSRGGPAWPQGDGGGVAQPVDEFPDDDFDDICIMECETPKKRAKNTQPGVGLHTKPYTYLKLLEDTSQITVRQIVKVKAFVSTLLGKLEHNNGDHWSLKIKINDGTAAMDVDLSDEMLQSLIGFTAQQCHIMKEQAKSNKQIRQKMVSGLKSCQQSLIQLSCILELDISPDSPRPTVLRKSGLTPQDMVALQNRQPPL